MVCRFLRDMSASQRGQQCILQSMCVCEKRLWGFCIHACLCVRDSPWLQSYIYRCGPPPHPSATGAADSTLGRRCLSFGGSSAVAYSLLSSLCKARETLLLSWKFGCQQQLHKKRAALVWKPQYHFHLFSLVLVNKNPLNNMVHNRAQSKMMPLRFIRRNRTVEAWGVKANTSTPT